MSKDIDSTNQLEHLVGESSVDEAFIFQPEADKVMINDKMYLIKRNFRDAFDLEGFKHRFADILLEYDYIVGDYSGDLLRMRGFYEEGRHNAPLDQTINHLEDYLMESVNFGAPYFVLEREEKEEKLPIEERQFQQKKPAQRKKKQKNKGKQNRQKGQRRKSRRDKQYSKSFKIVQND